MRKYARDYKVCEIKGICTVYKDGDRVIIDGSRILPDKIDAICIHAFSTLSYYVVALEEDADPDRILKYTEFIETPTEYSSACWQDESGSP